ncbi:sugar nucleotide-binding protein [Actinoplanes sp. TBRC 11911]|uniref:SDR family oxidoreductase n=1 Tax=Actinoplanes sp. TBRC 11911 TaxID=2729386 RepID=UPI00145EDD31|nr:sugar nucleotide-binding protein [Actinoplanes sp. TBRC 11911]NMO56287.1 sugar nucleotide-binding protein [Actinoplanes sp. TBRC 11911]
MTVLVVGASGYLGSELAAQASAAGHPVTGTSTTGTGGWLRLDVTDRSATHQLLASVRPQLVINTAYRNTSWTVCADGAANVALAAAAVGARLVHISSDALHAGRPAPYLDDDEPTPVHRYGAAKAAAETAVAAIMPAAPIVRTSLIIGDERSKQIQLALGLLNGSVTGALFSDEFRRPVAVHDLAAAVLELDALGYSGLINVAGPETVSRDGFGRMVARAYGQDPGLIPVSTIAEGGLGPRPANVLLDSSRAAALLKTRLRPASECVGPPGL